MLSAIDLQHGACGICGAEYDGGVWPPIRNSAGVMLAVVCGRCAKVLHLFNFDAFLFVKARQVLDSSPEGYPWEFSTKEDVKRALDEAVELAELALQNVDSGN